MMHRKRLHCFGSSCQLSLFAPAGEADELTAVAQQELQRLEQKFSALHPESLVSCLNQTAGSGHITPLDAEARSLFEFVSTLWAESSHLFDPTIRILENCYAQDGRIRANREQILGILRLVGWEKVEVSASGARLPLPGMLIDLDNCVRPYALDCVRRALSRHDVAHACIETDREAVTIGKQPDGSNWLLGVRHPYGSRSAIKRIKLNDRGYAMRGDFERRISFDGETYGRGLSPVDGCPVPGLLSVSVVADSCLSACSAASIARLRTERSAMNWLDRLNLPWLAIDRKLACHGPLAPDY